MGRNKIFRVPNLDRGQTKQKVKATTAVNYSNATALPDNFRGFPCFVNDREYRCDFSGGFRGRPFGIFWYSPELTNVLFFKGPQNTVVVWDNHNDEIISYANFCAQWFNRATLNTVEPMDQEQEVQEVEAPLPAIEPDENEIYKEQINWEPTEYWKPINWLEEEIV